MRYALDHAIDVATGTLLTEPGLFYLRFARSPAEVGREPMEHALPLKDITGVRIGLPAPGPRTLGARSVEATGIVSFYSAEEYIMQVGFDGETGGNIVDLRPELPLVLRW